MTKKIAHDVVAELLNAKLIKSESAGVVWEYRMKEIIEKTIR